MVKINNTIGRGNVNEHVTVLSTYYINIYYILYKQRVYATSIS